MASTGARDDPRRVLLSSNTVRMTEAHVLA